MRQDISRSHQYNSVILLFYVAMLIHKCDLLIWFAPPIKECTTQIGTQRTVPVFMFFNLKREYYNN